MTDFTHSGVSLDLAAARPSVAHYLAVFLASGHEGAFENVAPGGRLLAVLTLSRRDPSSLLAAFWLVAVAGLRPYLRCARLRGAK
jgi:hypothetical protein